VSAAGLITEVPDTPIALAEVLRRWPVIRQSDLATFDQCELSMLFKVRYEGGVTSIPQARGTIEHRVIAACVREMQRNDSTVIDPEVAKAILLEKLRQHRVPAEERVHIPISEIPVLERAMGKWGWDNALSIRDVLDTERRLFGTLAYRSEHGELVERQFSGQLDLMIQRGSDELRVVDWKGALSAPVKRHEDENGDGKGLSPEGFFQQRAYGTLALQNFPSLAAISLYESYHRITTAREARITRSQLPRAEELLSLVIGNLDAALASGPPPELTIAALERHGHWRPSPGPYQCRLCPGRRFCPVDDEVKVGGIETHEDAVRLAATRSQVIEIKAGIDPHLQEWTRLYGPLPVNHPKERRVLGHRPVAGGKTRFEEWAPDGMEPSMGPDAPAPATDLVEAMRASVAEARQQRGGERP
jgi:hypothetical protein